MIERLILFGATGDLVGRYLLRALAAMQAAGELPDRFVVVGAAVEDLDDEAFRAHARKRLDEHAAMVPAEARQALLGALRYSQVDVSDAASVGRAVLGDGGSGPAATGPVAVYLALPPGLFPTTVQALGELGLPEGSRIALEKPFGSDLESAKGLNRLLAEVSGVAGEQAVFRIDHFLGLATVEDLLGLRLANRILEPVWNSQHVDRIEIVWEETLGLEGRAGYYDQAGQLKDMIQSHLLQILCFLAMEAPVSLGERDLRDRKLDVLRTVRELGPEDMRAKTRRARWSAGTLGGRDVPAYAEEEGVDPARGTETFAEVELELQSLRWSGTRFVLRTAKGMGEERKEVVVRFRPVPYRPFGDVDTPPVNELRIGLEADDPGDLILRINGRAAGAEQTLVPLALTAELPSSELTEYSRVLIDLLGGDSRLAIRGDEAEELWRIVTPILAAWEAGEVPLEEYPAGSAGPPPR